MEAMACGAPVLETTHLPTWRLFPLHEYCAASSVSRLPCQWPTGLPSLPALMLPAHLLTCLYNSCPSRPYRRSLLMNMQRGGYGTAVPWLPTSRQRWAGLRKSGACLSIAAAGLPGAPPKCMPRLPCFPIARLRRILRISAFAVSNAKQFQQLHLCMLGWLNPAFKSFIWPIVQSDAGAILEAAAEDFGLADRQRSVEAVRTQDWEQSIKASLGGVG